METKKKEEGAANEDDQLNKIWKHLAKASDLWQQLHAEARKQGIPPAPVTDKSYVEWQNDRYRVLLGLTLDSLEWYIKAYNGRTVYFRGGQIGACVANLKEALKSRGF